MLRISAVRNIGEPICRGRIGGKRSFKQSIYQTIYRKKSYLGWGVSLTYAECSSFSDAVCNGVYTTQSEEHLIKGRDTGSC